MKKSLKVYNSESRGNSRLVKKIQPKSSNVKFYFSEYSPRPNGCSFVTVYTVVFIVGLVLNLTALVIFLRNSKSQSHTTIYMIHLAFADLILVCTLPVRIYYHGGFKGLPQKIHEFTGLILLANMYGSIFLLTCISFDRCVAVCFPLSSRVREGRKKAWCVCLGIWFLTIGTSLPIYFKQEKTIPLNISSNTEQCFANFPQYATRTVALTSTLIVGFGIPLTVMSLSSWGLIRAISKSTAAQNSELVDSDRIKRMITTNLGIFLCCFLPYHFMLVLLYAYSKPESIPCSLVPAYQYSLMIACLNAMLDPLAYYFTTETFRSKMDVDAVRKIWHMNSNSFDGNNRSEPPSHVAWTIFTFRVWNMEVNYSGLWWGLMGARVNPPQKLKVLPYSGETSVKVP